MQNRTTPTANAAANQILNLFQDPERLPEALANIYLQPIDPNAPSARWSFANRILMYLAGTSDARGFRQWQEAGRPVAKGSKAFHILAPCTKKITDKSTGEERTAVIGFRAVPVFRIEDTEGPEIETQNHQEFIDALPLVEVARAWGLSVNVIPGGPGGPNGYYAHGRKIALAVENLSTWAHELLHAADYRCGNLKEKGQHWRSETVAEFGGAVLLTMLGYPDAADLGGAYRYVHHYATDAGLSPVSAAMKCLDRIDKAISLILETAEQVATAAA